MAPEVRALAQSESKSKFMERLGLNERNPDHKHLYHMMKVSISTAGTAITERFSDRVLGRGQRWASQNDGNTEHPSR